jgi:hypothetical protein
VPLQQLQNMPTVHRLEPFEIGQGLFFHEPIITGT